MHFTNSAEEARIGWRVISEFLPQPSCPPDGVAFAAGFCNRPAAIALKARHAYSEAKISTLQEARVNDRQSRLLIKNGTLIDGSGSKAPRIP